MISMKWKKLGKIFDPTNFQLPNGCTEFAQSPQALVFDDFVRIYFSTRKRETNSNKYLSYVSFADFDKKFQKILQTCDHTIIELGELGCFDEHGIFPFSPVRIGDKIIAYTCGWSRRVSVSVETSIGLAVSEDNGMTFKKLGNGPVLTASLNEPFLINDAFVRMFDGIFHCWYSYGVRWIRHSMDDEPDRVYKIGHATSGDGISWKKEGRHIIDDVLNADECQALPSVIFLNDKYHMFFTYRYAIDFRKNPRRGYRIGYAYSSDLQDWTRINDYEGLDMSSSGWDSEMMCYPHVFILENDVYLLYNGNEFGKYGFGLAVLEW